MTAVTGPVAVIAHGSGSTADFVTRVFGPALERIGYRLVSWDRRGDVASGLAEIANLVEDTGATVVGGISIGAALAARYAAGLPEPSRLAGMLLALPPWLGRPGPVAAQSAAAAARLESLGLERALTEVHAGAPPWVAGEIRRAWSTYVITDLIADLRSTASTPGPTPAELDVLATSGIPTGLVALDGDPLHPAEIAAQWAAALPGAVLETVPIDAPAGGVDVIGDAALRAWQRAGGVSASR